MKDASVQYFMILINIIIYIHLSCLTELIMRRHQYDKYGKDDRMRSNIAPGR